jgi:DNA-binding transcriptional ArsR family regulator/phage baseplate assembly protein W
MWILHNGQASHPLKSWFSKVEAIRLEMGRALVGFWADRIRGFTEANVLARRSGTLLDPDLIAFFAGLDAACAVPGTPSLLSESDAERAAIRARLDRLRGEPALRKQYGSLLQSAWKMVEEEWQSTGRSAVIAAAADWRRRLDAGVGYREILERSEIWPGRPDLDALADVAAARGNLVLSPSWFGGEIHVIELDGMMYMGRGIQRADDEEERRRLALHVASNMKALSDPTRLSILLQVAHEPASVTELARHLHLSQPTVSGHVQVLREAGLLEERSVGRSSILSADARRLRDLLTGTQEALAKQFRR